MSIYSVYKSLLITQITHIASQTFVAFECSLLCLCLFNCLKYVNCDDELIDTNKNSFISKRKKAFKQPLNHRANK